MAQEQTEVRDLPSEVPIRVLSRLCSHGCLSAERGHSSCTQGVERDLGPTIQAEWKTNGAEAAVDVELHRSETELPFGEEFTASRKENRADERKTNLATMGVAAEHEADSVPSGESEKEAGVVRRVAEQDDGFIGLVTN